MVGDSVGVAISVSAANVTVADLTIRDVGNHAIQVRGERGASGFTLHNARVIDTGEQLVKVSVSNNGLYADNGLIACSDFSYTVSAPSDYTNGIDVLAGKGWVIRDNRFSRIRGPEAQGWRSGPTILVWKGSEDTVVERNLIIDSFRGIALGLGPWPVKPVRNGNHDYDHLGGLIRQNVVVNLNSWSDEAIEANAAQNVRIEHNTVLVRSTDGNGHTDAVSHHASSVQYHSACVVRRAADCDVRNGDVEHPAKRVVAVLDHDAVSGASPA